MDSSSCKGGILPETRRHFKAVVEQARIEETHLGKGSSDERVDCQAKAVVCILAKFVLDSESD
jgi:hypothetical protein